MTKCTCGNVAKHTRIVCYHDSSKPSFITILAVDHVCDDHMIFNKHKDARPEWVLSGIRSRDAVERFYDGMDSADIDWYMEG